MKAHRLVTLFLCAALGGAWMHAASAQNTAPGVQQPVPAYSDAELKTFAVAALEVLRINDVYLPKLKLASTPEEQQLVERSASDEMVKAVEREGMSVAKYKEIMNHAESNPEVAERVIKHMKDAQSAPGAGR
jgi:uncharacterized protein DUF4168